MSLIVNVQYPTQAATLPEQTAYVVGYNNTGTDNQGWIFEGYKPRIMNIATGTYASVQNEAQCVPVIGSAESYGWIVQDIDQACQIVTTDGAFVWRLTSGEDNAPIVLQATPYSEKDSLWVGAQTVRAK